jgi:hypothetical protein
MSQAGRDDRPGRGNKDLPDANPRAIQVRLNCGLAPRNPAPLRETPDNQQQSEHDEEDRDCPREATL